MLRNLMLNIHSTGYGIHYATKLGQDIIPGRVHNMSTMLFYKIEDCFTVSRQCANGCILEAMTSPIFQFRRYKKGHRQIVTEESVSNEQPN
jgi:hypothetical protein